MPNPRMTLQTQLVIDELLKDPGKPRYGLELCDDTGLPSGTVYPILARLEQVGWMESYWEDPEAHVLDRRPRRRYYRLTRDGAEYAGNALREARLRNAGAARRWGVPVPGSSGAF
jgi:PadR family transcriptional regulator, regulatory protein PadR